MFRTALGYPFRAIFLLIEVVCFNLLNDLDVPSQPDALAREHGHTIRQSGNPAIRQTGERTDSKGGLVAEDLLAAPSLTRRVVMGTNARFTKN